MYRSPRRFFLFALAVSLLGVAMAPPPSPPPRSPPPRPPPPSPTPLPPPPVAQPAIYIEEVSYRNTIIAGVVGGVLGLTCCACGYCIAQRRFADEVRRTLPSPRAAARPTAAHPLLRADRRCISGPGCSPLPRDPLRLVAHGTFSPPGACVVSPSAAGGVVSEQPAAGGPRGAIRLPLLTGRARDSARPALAAEVRARAA